MGTAAEMPKYLCHKIVHALKIQRTDHDYGRLHLSFTDEGYEPITINVTKGLNPQFNEIVPNDLGYYVVYEDGYVSWSPTKAFEDGYTLFKD